MTETTPIDPAAIAADARANFDLDDYLEKGLSKKLRSGSITVYTDEVTGDKHTEILKQIKLVKAGEREALIDPANGEELLPAIPLDTKALRALEKQQRTLEAELDRTALSFAWRAVPPIAIDAGRREALEASKGSHPEPVVVTENFDNFLKAYLFSHAVTKYRVHELDLTMPSLSLAGAQSLKTKLPKSEYERLFDAYSADQHTTAITYQAVNTPDF